MKKKRLRWVGVPFHSDMHNIPSLNLMHKGHHIITTLGEVG
jgi:hypothetical protein